MLIIAKKQKTGQEITCVVEPPSVESLVTTLPPGWPEDPPHILLQYFAEDWIQETLGNDWYFSDYKET